MDPELPVRITARRADLDELEEQPTKQLAEVRAERDELAVAERVLERMSEQIAEERASVVPAPGQAVGRAVMLIPHRTPDMDETMLPLGYQRILAVVRQAVGPVMARQVGDALVLDVSVRSKREPLPGKPSGSSTAAGCANCQTAGSPPACDLPRRLRHRRGRHRAALGGRGLV